MQVPEKFFNLTRDEQEEVATKQANKYYEKAEEWRRLAVRVRIGKTKAKTKEKTNK